MPTFDAIALVVADMAASIAFYQLLGVELPETPGEAHAALPAGPG
jgi:catechol 2,3-dioxygenase-like lactoylglutathione lyase family enzyme